MKIWLKVLYSVLVLMMAYSTKAQLASETELLELINLRAIKLDNSATGNLSVIQQIGEQQNARNIQSSNGSEINFTIIEQSGFRNSSYVEQSGSGLQSVTNQKGRNNESNLWSVGKNIQYRVDQAGNENSISSYIENRTYEVRTAKLIQEGNQNQINISLHGNGFENNLSDQYVRILQFGDKNEVTAHMEPFSAPIDITQTPGINGEGMKLNMSTSSFNFPMKK